MSVEDNLGGSHQAVSVPDEKETKITQEFINSREYLEVPVEGDFASLIEKISADLGIKLESRATGFHLTVVSPPEMGKVRSLDPKLLVELERISRQAQAGKGIRIEGIGYIDGSETKFNLRDGDKVKKVAFLTIDSPSISKFRRDAGLDYMDDSGKIHQKDLHITLGFVGDDIHMHIVGQNAKGKDILEPIPKKPDYNDHELSEKFGYGLDELGVKFGEIGGPERKGQSGKK